MGAATTDNHDPGNFRDNECRILARIYELVIQSHARKKAASSNRPDAEERSKDDYSAKYHYSA